MSIPKVDDFQPGPTILKGSHGQQIVDALRELDRRDGLDTSNYPRWDLWEIWPGVVTGIHYDKNKSSVSRTPTVSMYWVNREYIKGGETEDKVELAPATDDKQNIYPITNIVELADNTNVLEMGDAIVVFAFFDRGQISRKRYITIGPLKSAYIKITGNAAGGGYYTATRLVKSPLKIDYAVDLVVPLAPEELATVAVIAENFPEANGAGGVNSHWVAANGFYVAYLIGYSKDSPPKQVYRFAAPKLASTGTMCLQGEGVPECTGATEPDFTVVETNTTATFYNQNWFKVYEQVHAAAFCNPGTVLIDWEGMTFLSYFDDPFCKVQVVKFSQEGAAPEVSNLVLPDENYNKCPVLFSLTDAGSISTECNCTGDLNTHRQMNLLGYVYVPPSSPCISFYQCDGITLINTFGNVIVGEGLDYQDSGSCPDGNIRVKVLIAPDSTSDLSVDCDGLHFLGSSSYVLTLIDCSGMSPYPGITSIQFIDGLTLSVGMSGTDATVGLSFTPDFTIDGSSAGITQSWDVSSPCSPKLTVNLPPYPTPTPTPPPNTAEDCNSGPILGNWTNLIGLTGITLSLAGTDLSIGIGLTAGSYIGITATSCTYTIDASAAVTAANSYTDTQLAGLSSVYDPLGAAAAAQSAAIAAANAYTDTGFASLAGSGGAGTVGLTTNPGDWLTTQPTTQQEFNDRVAAALAGLLGGGIP